MSVLFRFRVSGMTRQQYDQVSSSLEDQGFWPPDGLQLHVMFGQDGDLQVSEIWESREKQATFSERLMPTLQGAGVQFSGPPEVFEVHEMQQP